MSKTTHPDHLPALTDLRRELHARPEISGKEAETATRVGDFLARQGPREMITGLGGHGIAAVFTAPDDTAGPTVVLRAELDALPIAETGRPEHASIHKGIAHLRGHDGHLALLCGVASGLGDRPLTRGRLILLCQPAEETGQGARAIATDPRWRAWAPDRVFALHNLPGHPLGCVLAREGPFTAGSVGLVADLIGHTAHAAQPEQGRSPAAAMSRLVTGLVTLPIALEAQGRLALVTVVHARLGEEAFGTSPGRATVMATLRAGEHEVLATLRRQAAALVAREATADGLEHTVGWVEEFPVTNNHAVAVEEARRAARRAGLDLARPPESPFRWSEDFGWLLADVPGALIGLGAGEDQPSLHAGDYDFPDALIEPGVWFWQALLEETGLYDRPES